MTYRPSQEVMRIAIMGERYGSGDMQTICRAFRELHRSSLIPTGEEAQPGPAPTPTAPAAACCENKRAYWINKFSDLDAPTINDDGALRSGQDDEYVDIQLYRCLSCNTVWADVE